MLTINKRLPGGLGLAPVLLKRAATVELDWDVRQKSRFDAVDSIGRSLGVFLPRGDLVRGGDVLVADDGSLISVKAADQPVLVVSIEKAHGTPFDLVRAAYHLGNRHVPLELQRDHLKLEPDHVLAEMLLQMHLVVTETNAPFEPEGGAYSSHAGAAGSGTLGHAHGAGQEAHDHDHDHGHPHEHAAHGHGHSPDAPPHEHAAHGHGHSPDAPRGVIKVQPLDAFGRTPSDPHYGHNHR